ncbi:MAG: 30S ribosomal protein S17 [bacterium]
MTRGKRQEMRGTVVGDRMTRTVVVQVETLKKHARYGKFVRRRKKYLAHDEKDECRTGDLVRIVETRPLSRRKRWRVVEIIERREIPTVEIAEPEELVMKKTAPAPRAERPTGETSEQPPASSSAEPRTAGGPPGAPETAHGAAGDTDDSEADKA